MARNGTERPNGEHPWAVASSDDPFRASVTSSSSSSSVAGGVGGRPVRCIGMEPRAFVCASHRNHGTSNFLWGEKKYNIILQIRDNTALHGRGRFDWFVFVFSAIFGLLCFCWTNAFKQFYLFFVLFITGFVINNNIII